MVTLEPGPGQGASARAQQGKEGQQQQESPQEVLSGAGSGGVEGG